MAIQLTSFEIGRLHGRRTIRLKIDENRLILVGENGSGKTTVINIIYYFLSRQWHRLSQYDFAWIKATVSGETIELKRDMLDASRHESRRRPYMNRVSHRIRDLVLSEGTHDLLADRHRLHELAARFEIPVAALMDYLTDFPGAQLELMEGLATKTEILKNIVTEEVLYLPTYRRIEQDLKAVFPEIDERMVKDRLEKRRTQTGFVELVEFGMEDVDRDIARKLAQLREHNREGLSTLANTFLRDVITERYRDVTTESIGQVDMQTVEAVFARIDEATLPAFSRARLREIVQRIPDEQSFKTEERIVLHFLLGLLQLHRKQQGLERDVINFVALCNKYLVGKEFRYDGARLALDIAITEESPISDDREGAGSLQLRDLSSGEKQIVSLFSHILLSGQKAFFILLDEPELSLSVPWQQSFLPDILATQRCTGLVAVTHSPFIFDNELEKFSHNLTEYWR